MDIFSFDIGKLGCQQAAVPIDVVLMCADQSVTSFAVHRPTPRRLVVDWRRKRTLKKIRRAILARQETLPPLTQGGGSWERGLRRIGLSSEIDEHNVALPPDDIAVTVFHGTDGSLLKLPTLVVVVIAGRATSRAQTERIAISAGVRLFVE
jgi:hypothetical protein